MSKIISCNCFDDYSKVNIHDLNVKKYQYDIIDKKRNETHFAIRTCPICGKKIEIKE